MKISNACAVGLTAALTILVWGCGKKNPPPATAPTAPEVALSQQPAAQPLPSSIQAPGTSLTQADGAVDLPELQRTVIRWVVANRRRPNSFEDFAATAGIPIPPPPAGKKYILTHDLHVQLVNR